ncbi:MAG: bifunctional UDP-N-acetylglucosamine diphosphorylase/glucosamine-1-phosphate N-acetyltransferase GlmU [Ahrensia sp.]|nr:bifunctional UDP-N-acetylglucosamine diphosphorylase/glucosamine-1-phosphate N-acetyltransferase GlmU [Ahrensia sp.]
MSRTCLTIILAAGKGTRMKSPLPKVLHRVAGLPMVAHVVNTAIEAGSSKIALVTGHGAGEVKSALQALNLSVDDFTQDQQLGTANAAAAARAAIDEGYDDVLVVFGDTPLVMAETLKSARRELANGTDLVVMGFHAESPTGYGRLVENDGKLIAIVEEKDATDAERKIQFCNGGLMAFNGRHIGAILDAIDDTNAAKEFYLTDAVKVASKSGLRVSAIRASADEVLGVNTRVELAQVETIWQNRARKKHMLGGVSMIAPETVFFHYDTVIEEDVTLEPHIFFGPKVVVKSRANIRAFSHLEGASIGNDCEIGPFARLRPGANLGSSSKVGNFCEVKNADVAVGAKINHLTYIGDASIGENSNIGAGTITCNYDGMNKFKTTIGANAFIGSNSSLVAPVMIGDNAYIASGSVITKDVPVDAVGFGRARQDNKDGLAVALRARIKAIKLAKQKT